MNIKEKLGYVLAPDYLPAGLQLTDARITVESGRILRGNLVLSGTDDTLYISYPVSFPAEGYLIQGDPSSARRPDDALSQVTVNGEAATVVRGQWSAETIGMGPGIDPGLARWDYDASLYLYFDIQVPGGTTVGVVIHAPFETSKWIAAEEMIRIAESFRVTE